MLTDICIEGFRGIRSMELNNLHPLNLMIGENNSGKTSVLEAIQLLKSCKRTVCAYKNGAVGSDRIFIS